MVSLIGALIGFAGSAVPSLFDFFNKKEETKKQIELMKMQAELIKQNAEIDLSKFYARAADDEHARLIAHDIAISNDRGLMAGLRKSVRPVITYLFFSLFAAVKISSLLVALEDTGNFHTAVTLIWDEETQGIFAAIISFWFGSRALEKKSRNG